MIKRITFVVIGICVLGTSPVFADRDWEYWSNYSVEVPITKDISYAFKPEWRMRDDMSYRYLTKFEQPINFKLGNFFELAPYYVWQESKSKKGTESVNMSYLDLIGKLPLKEFLDIKIIDRFRWQYTYEKGLTTWRNSTRVTRAFKLGQFELSPFIEDEVFYDSRLGKFSENRASAGISFMLNKHLNVGASYMLNTKRKGNDWNYANVLVTSASLKF